MATAAAAPTTQVGRDEYETIYILRPDVDQRHRRRSVVGRAQPTSSSGSGRHADEARQLGQADAWRTPFKKSNRGIFVYLKYVGFGDLVAELERNLRLDR